MIAFDIETGPLPEEVILRSIPEFDADKAVPKLGEFNPETVKLGRLTDEEKIKAKVDAAREEHEIAVANRDTLIDIARNDYHRDAFAKAALNPTTGELLTIGILTPTGDEVILEKMTEVDMLTYFWELFTSAHYDHKFVGFNTHDFDLPFLVKRSWLNRVKVPHDIIDFRGYFHASCIDLMKIWCLGSKGYVKMDRLAELLGCGRKTEGIDGSDFARLWKGTRTERKQAIAYLSNDLKITASVASAMGYE